MCGYDKLRLYPLPDAQGAALARLGGEIVRAFLAGRAEAEADRVAVQLVDAQLLLPLAEAFRHGVVDRLGFFGRVDREGGLHEDVAADGGGRLIALGDAL